ncbi:MAG: D-2-hydroxyacid dehydrogenase [Candidatus Faecousia sp.]|nr:D-2-hydroxyacid dehydrogenase [Candidatus Faecousia sp.]
MVLALCRRLPEYRDQQHVHRWQLLRYDKQLEGSTLLILGAGDIGTTLARWMRPMVGRIIGVRRVARACPPCFDRMVTLQQLDECLPEADIIVCALPHTLETIRLLDERRLRKMKKDAVLVNGGRGSLIDQDALCRLLDEGWFWGVGLEVAQPEPLPADSPLWGQPRVLITPHAAGNSFAPGSPLERKIWDFMIENVSRFLSGETPQNQVDFTTGYRRTEIR